MQFCKALGLIILFLPQIELYKKTKAHIIHTLGQDQVLLLSGKSWRIGEEICFPVEVIILDLTQCKEMISGNKYEVNGKPSGVWGGCVLGPWERTVSWYPCSVTHHMRHWTLKTQSKVIFVKFAILIFILLYNGRNKSNYLCQHCIHIHSFCSSWSQAIFQKGDLKG